MESVCALFIASRWWVFVCLKRVMGCLGVLMGGMSLAGPRGLPCLNKVSRFAAVG